MLVVDFGTLSRAPGVMAAALLLVMALASGEVRAAKLKTGPQNWSSEVLPQTANDRASEIVCDVYQKRMTKHVERLVALRRHIAQQASAPPGTVVAFLKSISGNAPENAAVVAARKKLEKERMAADRTNHTLAESNCQVVDIDAAVEKSLSKGLGRKALTRPRETEDILRKPE